MNSIDIFSEVINKRISVIRLEENEGLVMDFGKLKKYHVPSTSMRRKILRGEWIFRVVESSWKIYRNEVVYIASEDERSLIEGLIQIMRRKKLRDVEEGMFNELKLFFNDSFSLLTTPITYTNDAWVLESPDNMIYSLRNRGIHYKVAGSY